MTSPADAITDATRAVLKDWTKQRKAEERNANAAFNRRLRLMPSVRPTVREVAFAVMEDAYMVASDNGKLPCKPRQIMYVARPAILHRTGEETLGDAYFTQTLLNDYMEEYDCSDWDIVWDARGHFVEPHTALQVPLGTLEVRQYLGDRPSFEPPKRAVAFPTIGPKNRYRNVLFIEKEGFHPILQAARLQERFDIALMSTKGMSVIAARRLIDRLAGDGVKVFALHDFDRSGFSIFGTLGTDSRRYWFENKISVVDIGLRLENVFEMDLQSEPVPSVDDFEWRSRAVTLQRHGATAEEIRFLRTRRVELNAMTSRQFLDLIEAKLRAHGVTKLIPDDEIIEQQARRVIKENLITQAIAKIERTLAKQAKIRRLPTNLRDRVGRLLEEQPELPWDAAVAIILNGNGKA
jgi:hypothetical protein